MGKVQMYLTKTTGKRKYTFVVTGDNAKSAIIESEKLSFDDVETCGVCGGDDLRLGGHVTKDDGFEYAYVRCKKCRATLNMGTQKKNTDINYWVTREENGKTVLDWMKYEPKSK